MTLSPLEAIWLLVSLVGLVLSAANAMDAFDDWNLAHLAKLQSEGMVAADALRGELTRVMVHSLFFGVGALAAITPGQDVGASVIAALLVPGAFFVVQLAMIVNSLLARKTRKMLLKERLEELVRRAK